MATPKSGKKSGKKAAGGGKKKEKKGDKTSSGDRAGLIFPVGRIGSMLRKGGFSRRVGAGAQVYLAATLEYLTAELVELSAKAAGKGKRVNPRAVTLAVRHDNDLGSLLKDVTLARGGVVSSIHEALLKKKKKVRFWRERDSESEDTTHSHSRTQSKKGKGKKAAKDGAKKKASPKKKKAAKKKGDKKKAKKSKKAAETQEA